MNPHAKTTSVAALNMLAMPSFANYSSHAVLKISIIKVFSENILPFSAFLTEKSLRKGYTNCGSAMLQPRLIVHKF